MTTQVIGYRKGALNTENLEKLQRGETFEFVGTPNDFVVLPYTCNFTEDETTKDSYETLLHKNIQLAERVSFLEKYVEYLRAKPYQTSL